MSKKLGSMTDAEFLEWSRNFLQRIVSEPQVYGLTVVQADALGEAQGGYTAAYHVAAEPLTRTKGAVAQRREMRRQLAQQVRQCISIINGQPNLSEQQRIDLGLNIRKPPTPAPIPGKAKLDSVSMDGHNWTVRAHAGLGTRGRPAGVKGISYFVYVGEEAPSDPALWSFVSNTHEMEVTIPFDVALTPGTKVWATAFFRNSRDESGVAADPISTLINFGSAMLSKPMAIRKAA